MMGPMSGWLGSSPPPTICPPSSARSFSRSFGVVNSVFIFFTIVSRLLLFSWMVSIALVKVTSLDDSALCFDVAGSTFSNLAAH